MNDSKRVFINTLVLYSKVIITTLIWLYLTRVVLDVLGVEDYGIYTLIAGVIAILAFVNSALMASTQRFISLALGEKNNNKVKLYFSSSVIIHFTIGLIVIFVLELLNSFLFNGFLNIPTARLDVAKEMYQLMIFSTFFTILGVPFSSIINAYEDIWFIGFLQIGTTLLKLGIILIFKIIDGDKLILYTFWMTCIAVLEVFIQYFWCKVKYVPCQHSQYSVKQSRDTIKEMVAFTGWNTFGAFAVVGRNQGISTVLNIFFGPKINGIYGIANQVDGQLISFANTLTSAMTPQIVKSQGEGNRERLLFLSVFSSKLTFFLSAIFAVPLLIELPLVLGVWLKDVPLHTELYCRLVLYLFLICELYPGLTRGIQAVGEIKWQQILTSIAVLLPIPIGAILFKMGAQHYSVLFVMLMAQIVSAIITVLFSNKYYNLNIKNFFIFVVRAITSFCIPLVAGHLLDRFFVLHVSDLFRFITVTVLSASGFSIIFFFLCFSESEKAMIKLLLKRLFKIKDAWL